MTGGGGGRESRDERSKEWELGASPTPPLSTPARQAKCSNYKFIDIILLKFEPSVISLFSCHHILKSSSVSILTSRISALLMSVELVRLIP